MLVAEHARNEAHAGLEDHQRRRFAAGEHGVADADFLHLTRLDHPLIEALEATTEKDEAGPAAQSRTCACVSGAPRGDG